MSPPTRTLGLQERLENDACLDPPSDFVTFISLGRRLDRETAERLLCGWLERYKPLSHRSIAVLAAGTSAQDDREGSPLSLGST